MNTAQLRLNTSGGSINPPDLDDAQLVAALLARDEYAWREFVRRFGPVLRHQVGRILARAVRQVLDSDAIDDVIGDFYVAVLERDMRKLRTWYEGPRRARLASWLAMIASQIAVDHIRRSFSDRAAKIVADVDAHDDDPNRGGDWLTANQGERHSEREIETIELREERRRTKRRR